ncbi:MAG TPA: hypothetical protein VJN67_24720 [Stellaceae bacterium]|nr:hypothetical protein [Stellaceae bacterium]
MDRARRSPRPGDDERDGTRFAATRSRLSQGKPANDNRLGLRGWAERIVALAALIGLAALLAWKVAG